MEPDDSNPPDLDAAQSVALELATLKNSSKSHKRFGLYAETHSIRIHTSHFLVACHTGTDCRAFAVSPPDSNWVFDRQSVNFISCRAPVDPVRLATAYFTEVETSGASKLRCECLFLYAKPTCQMSSRYTQRILPILDTTAANMTEVIVLARKLLAQSFPPTKTSVCFPRGYSLVSR